MKKIFDSNIFSYCTMCGEIVVGNSPQIVLGTGQITKISDLEIAHRDCWEQTLRLAHEYRTP